MDTMSTHVYVLSQIANYYRNGENDCSVTINNHTDHSCAKSNFSYTVSSSGLPTLLRVSASSATAHRGDTVELTCSLLSYDQDQPQNVSWVLRLEDGNVAATLATDTRVLLRDRVFVFEDIRLEDGGLYCCQFGELHDDCVLITVLEDEGMSVYSKETLL